MLCVTHRATREFLATFSNTVAIDLHQEGQSVAFKAEHLDHLFAQERS